MLERVVSKSGVVFYASPLLRQAGVPHAFSTRLGGVSPAPFDSLNLGNPKDSPQQDDPQRIRENYRRLIEAAGADGRQLRRAHQVHGNRTISMRSEPSAQDDSKADALLTHDPACIVSIRTADCVPILLASNDARIVAAVHAGWRGVVADIISAAVHEMRKHTHTPLLAAVGPCIGFDAFEVGPEVLVEFRRAFNADAPLRENPNGKGFVDLRQAVRLQLLRAGLAPHQIDTTDRCTFRHRDEFYSHRRDHGITGRMATLIAPRH